jgi:SAM-dependent methyltransferase
VTASSPWPDSLFEAGADWKAHRSYLRSKGGEHISLHPDRWHGDVTAAERALLGRARGRVLDVGSGPGRLVAHLALLGRPALGLDMSPRAVAVAHERGAPIVHGSVFDTEFDGPWDTVLLMDGNVGIGGKPRRLFCRVAELLAPGGRLLAEVEGPQVNGGPVTVRVAGPELGPWFDWARVSVAEIGRLAAATGFGLHDSWVAEDRWFVELRRLLNRSGGDASER